MTDMEPDKDFTPNGCRIDRGRCFNTLEFEPATGTVLATFRDGSQYRYFGLSPTESFDWLAMIDPGCFFNHNIWPGQFVRLKGPD